MKIDTLDLIIESLSTYPYDHGLDWGYGPLKGTHRGIDLVKAHPKEQLLKYGSPEMIFAVTENIPTHKAYESIVVRFRSWILNNVSVYPESYSKWLNSPYQMTPFFVHWKKDLLENPLEVQPTQPEERPISILKPKMFEESVTNDQ